MGTERKIIVACVLVALVAAAVWLGITKARKPAAPEGAAQPESQMTVTLYFGAKDGSGLVPEARDIKASNGILGNLRAVVEALLGGPAAGGVALVPSAVTVRGVYIDDKTAYLDFSREMVADFAGGSTGEYLLVASIVHTVCGAFPEVDAVAILVEGEEVDTIGGHLDVSRPLHAKDWR